MGSVARIGTWIYDASMSENYVADPRGLHKRYIRNTPAKAIVSDVEILLCNLTNDVVKRGGFKSKKVYLNTKVLKHLYDKRPGEKYDAILETMIPQTKFPDILYNNKPGETATKCLFKSIGGVKYLLCLEEKDDRNEVVTCFRLREERAMNYLKNLSQIWSWESGGSPS